MKKRILSALLALAMTFSLMPAAALAADVKDFTDLSKDAWYYEYVAEIVEDGYMVGTSETTFSPDMDLTRAMFVVIISAVEEVKVDNSKESQFSDVATGTWYTGAVNWAAKNGIVAGVGDGKFEPERAITRQEMATMMNAYIEWNDSVKKVGVKAKDFVDEADIADWADEAVENIRKYGLIAGVPGVVEGEEVRYFLPLKTASRAEIATVVSNLAFFVNGGGGGGKKPVYTDYIYEAMENVIATVKAEIEDQINTDIKDTNADGQFTAGGEQSYVKVSGLKLSDKITAEDTRAQEIAGVISVDQDTIKNLLKTAIDYAMPIYNDLGYGLKDEAAEIAQTLIDKFEAETGIAVTKETAKAIIEAVKAKAQAAPGYAYDLWADNFIVDGEYIIGGIVVSSEFGAESKISVEAGKGVYFEGSKKDAIVELALAIAKDLYADLKACEEYTAINDIVLDATINVEFLDGAYAKDTEKFPHNYPLTVSLALEGDALDFVEYKYDGGQFVKVIIPEGVQAAYSAVANEMINKVITPIIKDAMADALGGFMVQPAAATYAAPFAPTIDMDALMDQAVSAWLDKNLTTGNMANSALLEYLNGNTDVELDNEVIYDMIDTTLEDTINQTLDGSIIPGGALAVEMAKDPEKLKETLKDAAPEAVEKLDSMGLTDYAISKTQDYLDPGKAEETGKSYAEEKREEMKETVDTVITTTIDKTINPEPEKPADPETPDVDAPEIDVPEIEIPEIVVPDVSKYVAALNAVAKLTSVETISEAKFSNLAAALRNDMFQDVIAGKGDATVARVTKLISKLPAAAAIEIDGVVINEAKLDAVRNANTTIEACEAVADLIDEFGGMSIASFENGEDIIVKYGEKSWLANLMIEIK